MAVGPQITIEKNMCGFKFGGSVRDRHTYNIIICKYEILAVAKVDHQTAKFTVFNLSKATRLYRIHKELDKQCCRAIAIG